MSVPAFKEAIDAAIRRMGVDEASITERDKRAGDLLSQMRFEDNHPPDYSTYGCKPEDKDYWAYRVEESRWWFARGKKLLQDLGT